MNYACNYSEIKKNNPKYFRDFIRKYVLDGLSFFQKLNCFESELNKPRVQFLYMHHVFKDEETKLDALLKKLSRNHEFISYSESVSKILSADINKPYVCISFDDGLKNNVEAAKILNEYNAKACFFINPSIIEQNNFREIEIHCKNRLNLPAVEFMNWDDVYSLQKMGHEIGSHTMEHINVASTRMDYFIQDCKTTFDILVKRCGIAKHFAFPYGRFFHFNEIARDIVFDSGFISCATAERGCHINNDRILLAKELYIRRDHVILDWNLDHIFFFIANNSRNASFTSNLFKV